jgi:hypothetical protein
MSGQPGATLIGWTDTPQPDIADIAGKPSAKNDRRLTAAFLICRLDIGSAPETQASARHQKESSAESHKAPRRGGRVSVRLLDEPPSMTQQTLELVHQPTGTV